MNESRTLRTSRHIDAPPQAVFAAIQDPARLARWWGPAGFTNTFEVFEFRPGGRWKFVMHGPDGTDYANDSEFIDIEPAALVSIRHVSAPHFVLRIGLAPSDGGTRVSWDQEFDDAKVAQSLASICVPANEQNLDRLARELAAGVRN